MNLISDYLARAAEARKTAETITDPQARAEILKIAEVCERLAARHPGVLTLPPELDLSAIPANTSPITPANTPPATLDADKPANQRAGLEP